MRQRLGTKDHFSILHIQLEKDFIMKKFICLFLFILIAVLPGLVSGQEGMWLPNSLRPIEQEMRGRGLKMDLGELYDEGKGSAKDAVVLFGGGCTGALISPDGLLLTNHHCGNGSIQNHSTLEHNYLEEGFWAPTFADELPNPGLKVTLVVRMEDITAQALEGVPADPGAAERQSMIEKNLDRVRKSAPLQPWEEATTKAFFEGAQYMLIVTVSYPDVRLVGAPPASIGNFGDDTDNWVWPRHTGDFTLFRVYAGPDNRPAEYSPDNIPFKPKHFLPISLKGVKEGDFTLVMGFPYATSSYLPSYGVKQVLEVNDPVRVGMRDISMAHLGEASRENPETNLKYAAKMAGISNGWKKWKGEIQGLRRSNAVGKKEHLEEQFAEIIREDPGLNARYGHLLRDFRDTYSEMEPFQRARVYFNEAAGVNVELFRVAFRMIRQVRTLENQGAPGFQSGLEPLRNAMKGFFSEYEPGLDQRIFADIMKKYFTEVNPAFLPEASVDRVKAHGGDFSAWAADIYQATVLTKPGDLEKLLDGKPEAFAEAMKADPFYQLTVELNDAYSEKVAPVANELTNRLADLQGRYMQALMEAFPKRRFYPDANGTLRVSFGRVAGYSPRDAVKYGPQTTLTGVMEKYIPGDFEFDVPEKLRKLYDRKEFGRYGVNGEMPLAFIATNHTTGGNSGSPVLDGQGNLIGLNFDRVWEGTMSDVYFDGEICRNISVDIRYILFIIDKVGNAQRLLDEMVIR